MRIGRLDKRCAVQSPTKTFTKGKQTTTYTTLGWRWMEVKPRNVESQPGDSNLVHVVRMRHYPGLLAKYRILVPGIKTTLASAIGTVDGTTATVSAALGDSANAQPFHIRVDDELMNVTAGHGTTSLTVTRGHDGTTAATHASGAAVIVMRKFNIAAPTDVDERRRETLVLCTEEA